MFSRSALDRLPRLHGHPFLPGAVLLIGLTLTGLAGWLNHHATQEELASRFDVRAAQIRADADNRVARIDEMLRSLSAYASTGPTRGQWLAFMAKVQPGRNLAEVRSVSYIPHVYDLDKYAFSKDPKRRAAIDYAWQNGKIGLTGILPLAADNGSPRATGVIAYRAVFRHDLPARTARERARAVAGYVAVVFDARALLQGLLRDDDEGYVIGLRDLADGAHNSAVFTAAPTLRDDSSGSAGARADWSQRQFIEIGGHPWELEMTASRAVVSRHSAGLLETPLIVIGGTLLSLVFALTAGSLASTRRRAQQLADEMTASLRETEAFLQTVINALPSPVFVKDEESRWVFVNQAFCDMHGQPAEAFMGGKDSQNLAKLEPEAQIRREDEMLFNTGSTLEDESLRQVRGEQRWYLRRKTCVRLPTGARVIVGLFSDIHHQKQVEQTLREREALLSAMLKTAPDAIVTIASDGTIVTFNPAAERVFGYEAHEVVGREIALLMPDEYAPQYRDHLVRFVEAQRRDAPARTREIAARRKDGAIVPIELAIGEVVMDGRHLYAGFLRDISARKNAERALRASEQELREHHDHLQHMVEERTRELVTALIRAETASRAKSEFLANMSHELRTPLHAILSFAKLGAEKTAAAKPQPTRLSQYFSRIQASGQRLLALLNDLLDLAKLEAGKMRYAMAEHDLAAALKEALTEFEALARAKRVRIAVDPAPARTRAWFDPVRIGQVLRNLLSNAIKFSPEGGEIRIALAAEGNQGAEALALTISDAGPGIPAAELETVFDKFVQSSKTRSGAGGTGLGLSICREIVTAHGGSIHAFNNPGGGASLRFNLPVKAASSAGASNDQQVRQEKAA